MREPSVNDIPDPPLNEEDYEALKELKKRAFNEKLKQHERAMIRERT